MPEVRSGRSLGERIGAAVTRTSTGVTQGGGIAVEQARIASRPGQPLQQSVRGGIYTGDDSHGPGSDLTHTFTFDIPSGGRWMVQISVIAECTAPSGGSLFIGASGGVPLGTGSGPIPLFEPTGGGTAAAGDTFTCLRSTSTGPLSVAARLEAPGATDAEFTVTVTAFQI